jgi:branched-chain amino acid transport system permease protein
MILFQQLIAGLAAGAGYGLLGLAIVIVMKSTDVPNFAAAEVGLVGAYVCWSLMFSPNGPQISLWVAIPVALAVCALSNVVIQVLLVRPFTGLSPLPLAFMVGLCAGVAAYLYLTRNSVIHLSGVSGWLAVGALSIGAALLGFLTIRSGIAKALRVDHFALLLMTIAVVFLISAAIHEIWGPEAKGMPMPWTGEKLVIGGLPIGAGQLVSIVTGFVVAMGIGVFFKTTWGVRMRAIAEDGNTARLLGINSSRISMMAWAIAGVISGITMILKTSQSVVEPGAGAALILSGFIAAVLGGFTSLGGTFLGGLIVGVGEALAGGLIGTSLQPTIALLVVVVVLLLSPNGLTAEKKRRQV